MSRPSRTKCRKRSVGTCSRGMARGRCCAAPSIPTGSSRRGARHSGRRRPIGGRPAISSASAASPSFAATCEVTVDPAVGVITEVQSVLVAVEVVPDVHASRPDDACDDPGSRATGRADHHGSSSCELLRDDRLAGRCCVDWPFGHVGKRMEPICLEDSAVYLPPPGTAVRAPFEPSHAPPGEFTERRRDCERAGDQERGNGAEAIQHPRIHR